MVFLLLPLSLSSLSPILSPSLSLTLSLTLPPSPLPNYWAYFGTHCKSYTLKCLLLRIL